MNTLTPAVVMLGSFWLSGFLAAQKQAFFSLLTIVVATIVTIVLVNKMETK